MEEKEILEGNKIIGQFMGWKYSKSGKTARRVDNDSAYRLSDIHYDSSWDWLMPVVEKISRIEFDRKYDEDQEKWIIWTHHPVTFGMLNDKGQSMVRFYCSGLFEADTLIEAAYLAVVDFIKWHNTSPK